MNYTKHQIKRIRDLNDEYFEVVFNKRGLNFLPGSQVKFHNSDLPPVFIASGIQEPWVRVILNRDYSPNFPPGSRSVRLSLDVDNPLPALPAETSPNFLITAAGVGAFFSYASTFPNVKCKVCYMGDNKVQEEWVKSLHKIVTLKELRKEKNVYVVGDKPTIEPRGRRILNICKDNYLYEC